MDRTRLLPTASLAGFAALAAALALVPGAAAQDDPCDPHTALFDDLQYYQDGALAASGTALQGNVHAGGNLTAQVTVADGCEATVTLVAYDVDTGADMATAVSVDTQNLAEGVHNLTVSVPDCTFQVDLVVGAVVEAASSPEVLYQAEGRLLAYATGTADCATATLPELPCPVGVQVTAQADGSILLEFAAPVGLGLNTGLAGSADGTALAILRSTPGAPTETVATLSTEATSYLDTGVEEGTTYLYTIVLVHGDAIVSAGCPANEATSIPDLGTGAAVAAAGILGTAGYALARRRKE